MVTKVCCSCKLPKSDFGKNKNQSDGLQRYCKECGRARDKKCYLTNAGRKAAIDRGRAESKERNRRLVLDYLLTHPCVDCGESEVIFLDFDHVNGSKRLEVSTAVHRGWSIESLQSEIEKCEVRCIRCHRIRTAKQFGWWRESKS